MNRELLGDQSPEVAESLNNLAYLYYDLGDIDRALDLSSDSLSVYRDLYGAENHPYIARGMQNLAGWLVEAGDYSTAEPLLQDALAMNQALFESSHPDIAITQTGLAVLLLRTERVEAALEIAQEAQESLAESFGADHWRTVWALATHGASLAELLRLDEAEPLLLKSYEALRNNAGARPVHVETVRQYIVDLYTAWGRPQDAARY